MISCYDHPGYWFCIFFLKVDSCQLTQGKVKGKDSLLKRRCILYATSEDESYSDLEPDNFELEIPNPPAEDGITEDTSYHHVERTGGKPGFISFYGQTRRSGDESTVSIPGTNQNDLLWFVGPTVLVASFVFPSLYLRRILTTIFEDSLLTGRLSLAIWYCFLQNIFKDWLKIMLQLEIISSFHHHGVIVYPKYLWNK